MTTCPFDLSPTHPSWREGINKALSKMDSRYLNQLSESNHWLPGANHIFKAFSLPVDQVNYVLFGESPYPRAESANGYAFWDNAVNEIWSETGLSKKVNRATSLRNIIKMLLIAEDKLSMSDTSQAAIANINKDNLVQTNQAFFQNLINHGILLLNATLVLQPETPPQKDAKAWQIFMQEIVNYLLERRPEVTFILFGNIALAIEKLLEPHPQVAKMVAEHPYNLSFITNPKVLAFFKPLTLLRKI